MKNPRLILGLLALLAIVGIGGGLYLSEMNKGNVVNNQPPSTVTSTQTATSTVHVPEAGVAVSTGAESIALNPQLQLSIPSGWTYPTTSTGSIVNLNACENAPDSVVCEYQIFVSSAKTGPEAILDFSKNKFDFSWFCAKGKYGECSSDQERLAQVEKKAGYWTASSVGITDNAAIAIPYDGMFVVVFGYDQAQKLYDQFLPLLK